MAYVKLAEGLMVTNENDNEYKSDMRELVKYLKAISASAVMDLLHKAATTPERQQIWRLADGSHSKEEIAKQIGVTLRTVQYFVQEAENMGIIVSEKRGYPQRLLNIYPKERKLWKATKGKGAIQPTNESEVGESS